MSRASGGHPVLGNGTPEQVHLTWGDDPATSVVVSWTSPARAVRPRVRIGQRVILARERSFTDATSGKAAWAYHAAIDGLRPGAAYGYAVTADNDATANDPFTSTFRTAPEGRAAFWLTASGDLAGEHSLLAATAATAAGAVESFQPLFHLLNGGLCDATPAAWRDLGERTQFSAASRPWMPVPGTYQPGDNPRGLAPYLARYALPADGSPGAGGRWYSFRVGAVAFVCLDSAQSVPGTQAHWLEQTLARARGDSSVDWIIAALHEPAWSTSASGEHWLSLFARHEVDLVLTGHGRGDRRAAISRGTVHLALGGGIATFHVSPAAGAYDEPAIAVACYRMTDNLTTTAASDDPTRFDQFTLAHPRSNHRRMPA